MPDRRTLGPAAALVVAAGLLAGCGSAPAPPAPEPPAPSRSTLEPAAQVPEPARVSIPSLDLDRDLIALGLGGDGELEVPEDPADVGWFDGGGRPGGPGPTVVVGHLDSRTGPAVFSRLGELREGDRIDVTDADGGTHAYRVTSTTVVPQDRFPTEAVFGRTADDRLRLITCTGDYDRGEGRYADNRVVEAVPV